MGNSAFGGDTLVYSYGESSAGDTESTLPVFDDKLGCYSDDEIGLEASEPPWRVAVYMAGNESKNLVGTWAAQNSTAVGTVIGTDTSTPAPDAASSGLTPVQALVEIMTTLGTLLASPVTTEN